VAYPEALGESGGIAFESGRVLVSFGRAIPKERALRYKGESPDRRKDAWVLAH